MRRTILCLLLIASSTLVICAQQEEPLGDVARRAREEKARRASQPKADVRATYNDDGTINAEGRFERGMDLLLAADTQQRGMDLIRSSADLNYVPAQVTMGYFAETNKVSDYTRAAEWYKKAAEQGDPLAGWLLGRLYLTSKLSGGRHEARQWLEPAAQVGDPFAQYLMGLVLEPDDPRDSADWYHKAAEQGLPQAQKKYGLLLRNGRGGTTDKYEAYVWLLASSLASNNSGQRELRDLEASLGSTEVERARQEARSKPSRASLAGGCTGWSGEFDDIPSPPTPDLHRYCR